MEEQVLYNVLRNVGKNSVRNIAPSDEYFKALISIGMIKTDWDKELLTDLGRLALGMLRNKFEKW